MSPPGTINQEACLRPLNLVLFDAGVASRRGALELVASGRVTVNGKRPDEHDIEGTVELGEFAIDLNATDTVVALDGDPIQWRPQPRRYVLVHKPRGVLCACVEDGNQRASSSKKRKRTNPDGDRPLVTSLVPSHVTERLGHAGRLDLDSEGLVLMTNDHALMDAMLQPGGKCSKVYEIKVCGNPTEEKLTPLREGATIGNLGQLMPCDIVFLERVEPKSKENGGDGDIRGYSLFRVTLKEGKKNQIRRMFGSIGHRVVVLRRISLVTLTLDVPMGGARELTSNEVDELRHHCLSKESAHAADVH